jgi:polyphosphate kinase
LATRAKRPRRERASATEPSPLAGTSSRFLNRELSWLDFDGRVLEAAADPRLPLLERTRLCAIVSSNLDEFFAVRMAGLEMQIAATISRRSPDGSSPTKTLARARSSVVSLEAAQDALWLEELKPALRDEGIKIVSVEECGSRELRSLKKHFDRQIRPLLTPIAVGPAAPFPRIPALALNVGLLVGDERGQNRHFVRVNIPDDLPRFLEVGEKGVRVALEEVVLHFLPNVVGGSRIEAQTVFRITRDADLSIDSDADDLLEAVETQLLRRRFGSVVRLETTVDTEPELVAVLEEELGIAKRQTYERAAPLGLSRLMELTAIDDAKLKNASWHPVTRRALADRDAAGVLARIRRRDILVHHPYDAFDSSVQAFVSASRDPKVVALKATVYRTGDPSPTLASLVDAAGEDKQAVALVELKARFDERRNIGSARALERAGVDVVYGVPDLKVHAKMALLVRREHGGVRRYVHIGTGNYHASNASNYEDLSLFTADEQIAADVAEVFNAVTGLTQPAFFHKLLVGPWFLRDGLLYEIERVISAARGGEPARIRIKVNSLTDVGIIDALYAASSAGVTVELITRGICVLRPGVPGLSELITVRSVLGRFLEHSRIFSFQTGDGTATWIGSADLMPRNLDGRIEVLVPVEDARLRAEIDAILDALLADTRFAWNLDADGVWHRISEGARAVSAQETLMARAVKRARKHASRARP